MTGTHAPPGPGLRRPRLARVPLPARPEDPRHRARLPRRHHRPRADHRLVRPATRTGTWPSPPAPPDPTSWTSTSTARPGTGTPRSPGSADAGLLDGAAAYVRTPSGGLHAYFTGSAQRNGHLPAHHLDFRVPRRLRPGPALPGRRQALPSSSGRRTADGALDWAAVTALLEPQRQHQPPAAGPGPGRDLGHLARWVAAQPEGNRNAGLFWAANRALEADPAADLSPLAAAARQAGLADPRSPAPSTPPAAPARPDPPPDHQAEAD